MTDEQLAKNIADTVDAALAHIVPRVVREEMGRWHAHRPGPHDPFSELTDAASDTVEIDPSVQAWLRADAEQQKTGSITKRSVLETAIQTVADRGVPYGGVEDNFNRIARLWNAHLSNAFGNALDRDVVTIIPQLQASDVVMMMALMKIARLEANPGHMDSWVDVAGYAACGGEIGAKLAVDSAVG